MVPQNFQQLNVTAFRKILKKHDKLLKSSKGLAWHQSKVMTSDISTNQEVDRMIAEVEELVTTKLEKGDHKKAMKRLRVPPLGHVKDTPWTLCQIGSFIGVFITLMIFLTLITSVILHVKEIYPVKNDTEPIRIESKNITILEVAHLYDDDFWYNGIAMFRGLWLISFMFCLIGVNVHGWGKSGINHVLIFELDPRNHLSGMQIILIGLGMLTASSFAMVAWVIHPFFSAGSAFQIGPYFCLFIVILYAALLLNPFPILYYTSRMWLLKIIGRIICAPFFHVRFADFWLADQMNSLVPVFHDCLQIASFYVLYWTSTYEEAASQKKGVPMLIGEAVISCIPAWFRFAQCLRRHRDTPVRDRKCHPHLSNAGKYSTTFLVIICKTANNLVNEDNPLDNFAHGLWICSMIFSTCYTFTWDITQDWGLMKQRNRKEENWLLRDQILYRYPAYYYMAIACDLVLRFAWTLQVSTGGIGGLSNLETIAFKTALTMGEMCRRFVWNFFRLENEQINNCGKFRAVRDISIKPIVAENDLNLLLEMMDGDDGVNTVRKRQSKKKIKAAPQSNSKQTLMNTQNTIQGIKRATLDLFRGGQTLGAPAAHRSPLLARRPEQKRSSLVHLPPIRQSSDIEVINKLRHQSLQSLTELTSNASVTAQDEEEEDEDHMETNVDDSTEEATEAMDVPVIKLSRKPTNVKALAQRESNDDDKKEV